MTRTESPKNSGGFTLVELMIVISIILVLMGMVVTVGPMVMEQVKRADTEGKLNMVALSITRYIERYDVAPSDSEVDGKKINNTKLLEALKEFGITEDKLKDSWGRPLIYDRAKNERGELEINKGFPSDPRKENILNPEEDENIYQKFFLWSTGKDDRPEAKGDDILLEH